MTVDSFLVEIDSYTSNANLCKQLVLEQLFQDKIISLEQLNSYKNHHQIIIVKKSWFRKLLEGSNDKYIYSYVPLTIKED